MINFIGNRRKAYAVSIILIVAGLISMALVGLNLGIDFTGGTVFQLNLGKDFSLEEARDALDPFEELEGAAVQVVQERDLAGEPTDEGLIVRGPYMGEDRREAVMEEFQTRFPQMDQSGSRVESVGPVIGGELTRQAVLALAVAIVAMIAYITYRFEFKFALATIAALLHNIIIVLGIFSVLQLEINVPFVAAILTVFGYSVNDTIVIMDRIRENIGYRKKKDYAEIVNQSINQNLIRSINTSLTTLFVLTALLVGFHYFIGSLDLIVFVVALILGVLVGTYSSIFIASPLWLNLQDYKIALPGSKAAGSK
ncbi:MAG: protein translocase subunit SecF [Bacillota bacterium]